MRRITPVKSQETLKSDIFCLKRQLSLIADENQLLKVKIRRLENELRRKDKYIECFQTDSLKDRGNRRFLYDSGASMIYKLQKRNEYLEDMLLERDMQIEKRYNNMKTMCLYSHIDCKANRRGFVTNVARQNSVLRNNTSYHGLDKINTPNRFDSKKPSRMRSTSSLQSENCEKKSKNRYCVISTGDFSAFHRRKEDDAESASVIKNLQSEMIADKRAIRSKNAEISRLSAELREIKSLLKSREDSKVTKSTSMTQLDDRQLIRKTISRDRPNFIEENKRNVSRARTKRPERKFSRKTIQYTEEADLKSGSKRMPTVDEQNEEIGLPNESNKTTSDISSHNNTSERALNRPKTRIEYVFDSEVSSDGEEFCLPSNLRSFLQQAVNTMPNIGDGAIISD